MHILHVKKFTGVSSDFFFTGDRHEREEGALQYLRGPFLLQSTVEIQQYCLLPEEAYQSMQYLDDSHSPKGNTCPGPDYGSDQYGIGIEITTAQSSKEAEQQKLIVDAVDQFPCHIENEIRQHDKKAYYSKSDFLDIPNANLLAISLKETDPYYEIERAVKSKLKKLDSYKPFNEQWLVVITPYPFSCIDMEKLSGGMNNNWDSEDGFERYIFLFLNGDVVIVE